MSFLKSVFGAGADTAAAPGAVPVQQANPMANGLGHLFGTDGAHVSDIASRIGTGANQIAIGGGAQPGYAGPAPVAQQAAPATDDPNNHLQMLDQDVLRAVLARFRPTTGVQY